MEQKAPNLCRRDRQIERINVVENQEFKVAVTCGQICKQGESLGNCLENIEGELAKSVKKGFKARYWNMPKQPNGLPLKWIFSSLGGKWIPTGLANDYTIYKTTKTEVFWVSNIDPTKECRMIRPTEFFQ
jgi:hypothetical protein